MTDIHADLCIIGAGSGGLSVAAGAAQLGARVVLIEKGAMGGDCLNSGCVPSKALLAAAQAAHAMTSGARFGIAPVAPQVDFAAVMAHVQGVIAAIAPHDSEERFTGLGVQVIRAAGQFTGPDVVEAGSRRIRARFFVIATGSRPVVPTIPGLAGLPYLTNETVFAQTALPAHLLILGGGPIGVEMAQAHRRLGAGVTLVEAARVLAREDAEAAALVVARLRAEGVEVLEHTTIREASGTPGTITLQDASGRSRTGTALLIATGRRADVEGLGLEAAGVAHDRGRITVDAGLRTTNRRIFAIGDVTGGLQFTHMAGYQAGLVIRAALFRLPVRLRTDHVPRVTYTDPELAQIGLTEAEARAAHGTRLEVVREAFATNDRAQAKRAGAGFLKLMLHRGRPVGVTIVGAEAGELIHPWALMQAGRMRIGVMAGMVAPYPTLGEIGKRAAGAHFARRLFGSPVLRRVVRFLARF